ncbi:hypothetical protein PSACC_03439 [Paramicrosporidium saccamoebae]|uniref:Uncharacterized protein n=1 Tax=Paramicrosporidium saccamoebae TaxID=1246581 RepID=A0A2H9TG38_9FUNG|nr:hypothetical protein PSACC_03439 [Paramicrosporidium saccamoebae]
MLDYIHHALLHAVRLYDSLHHWLLRQQLTGELLLNGECRRLNVPLVTVLDRNVTVNNEPGLDGCVQIKGYDQPLLRHLQSSTGQLTSLPGTPVDLVISTQQTLNLGGVDCTQLGFAELCHVPEHEFITANIFRYAISQYSICRQNCGNRWIMSVSITKDFHDSASTSEYVMYRTCIALVTCRGMSPWATMMLVFFMLVGLVVSSSLSEKDKHIRDMCNQEVQDLKLGEEFLKVGRSIRASLDKFLEAQNAGPIEALLNREKLKTLDEKLDATAALLLAAQLGVEPVDRSGQYDNGLLDSYERKIEEHIIMAQKAIEAQHIALANEMLLIARNAKKEWDLEVTQRASSSSGALVNRYLMPSNLLEQKLKDTYINLKREEFKSRRNAPPNEQNSSQRDAPLSDMDCALLEHYRKQVNGITLSARQMLTVSNDTNREKILAMVRDQKFKLDMMTNPKMEEIGGQLLKVYREQTISMDYKINEALGISNNPNKGEEQKGTTYNERLDAQRSRYPSMSTANRVHAALSTAQQRQRAPKTVADVITIPATFCRLEPYQTDEWLAAIYKNFKHLATKYLANGWAAMVAVLPKKNCSLIVAVFRNVVVCLQNIQQILPEFYGEAVSADINRLIGNYYSNLQRVAEKMRA